MDLSELEDMGFMDGSADALEGYKLWSKKLSNNWSYIYSCCDR